MEAQQAYKALAEELTNRFRSEFQKQNGSQRDWSLTDEDDIRELFKAAILKVKRSVAFE